MRWHAQGSPRLGTAESVSRTECVREVCLFICSRRLEAFHYFHIIMYLLSLLLRAPSPIHSKIPICAVAKETKSYSILRENMWATAVWPPYILWSNGKACCPLIKRLMVAQFLQLKIDMIQSHWLAQNCGRFFWWQRSFPSGKKMERSEIGTTRVLIFMNRKSNATWGVGMVSCSLLVLAWKNIKTDWIHWSKRSVACAATHVEDLFSAFHRMCG